MKRMIVITSMLLMLMSIFTFSCGGKPTFESSITTVTEPDAYISVEVSPGGIYAKAGEQIEISCNMVPTVNTFVNITSVEVAFFDSHKFLVRKQAMNYQGRSLANTTYVIRGDEASYRPLINFSVDYPELRYYSEYTAYIFPIIIHD